MLNFFLIGVEEPPYLGRIDRVPGIAGDQTSRPASSLSGSRYVRLAGQEGLATKRFLKHVAVLPSPELREIGAEQHVEDGIGLGARRSPGR